MTTAEQPSGISPDMVKELEEAVDRLVKGIRDPEAVRRACRRMDQMREEMRQRVGEGEWAVNLVREARDEE
jgi:hypothetical protein